MRKSGVRRSRIPFCGQFAALLSMLRVPNHDPRRSISPNPARSRSTSVAQTRVASRLQIPVIVRSRWARTITSTRPMTPCISIVRRHGAIVEHRFGHRRALRAGTGARSGTGRLCRRSGRLWLHAEGDGEAAMTRIDRRAYAEMYGPTVGDRVRLGDTDLIIEVERDLHHLRRGSEVRRRQGDSRRHGTEPARRRGGRRHHHHQCADR